MRRQADEKNAEKEAKIAELTKAVAELQAKNSETDRRLLAAQADADKCSSLEAQIRGMKGGGDVAEAQQKKAQEELERTRTENTHLKMKVQQLKEQQEIPTKSPATLKLLQVRGWGAFLEACRVQTR